MLLNELPVEIQIKIYSNLDIKSIYNLLVTNKDINFIVDTHFIKKEIWCILNEFQDLNDIIKLINSGYRYISLNKRIQLICNYSLVNKVITQIMTNKGLYGVNLYNLDSSYNSDYLIFPKGKSSKTHIAKILIDSPYNFKRKSIIKSN